MTPMLDATPEVLDTPRAPCRPGCGACCIEISISTPVPGFPLGKPAGVRCEALDDNMRCTLFGQPERPQVCHRFRPDELFCGRSRAEAIINIRRLERLTAPAAVPPADSTLLRGAARGEGP